MSAGFIAVKGATGNTGKKITETLLKAGEKVKALVQAGFSERFANLYVEMTRAFDEGTIKPARTREYNADSLRRFCGRMGKRLQGHMRNEVGAMTPGAKEVETRPRIVVAIFSTHPPRVGGITRATFRRTCLSKN
jgi:hypothetical protein